MCAQFIFGSESYVTLCFAHFVWTDVMCLRKMTLQARIALIIHVPVVVAAQMTSQMFAVDMVVKGDFIEKEFLAEITVWMWHYFSVFVISHITIFNMVSQLFYMVESLFTDEDAPALKAYFAECFFVVGL